MKVYSTAAWRVYFSKVQVNNAGTVPAKGPVIFIPNHQNAFLDAVLVICTTPRNPWSIARASVFKEGFVTFLLTAVQIKPVFRVRDGFGSLRNNDAIIQEWTNMLGQGNDILIFAEGNHNEPYATGSLQRGFARMTLQFQQKHPNIPLTIVPVGFHYDDHHSFRSRVLLNYGDAIVVNDILKDSMTEREKLDTLVDITDGSLKSLALEIKHDDQYKAKVEFLRKYRRKEKDMLKQLEADREILSLYPNPPTNFVPRKKFPMILNVINPIVWIGWILHILPYSFIRGFIKAKVKDPQFISSLKYAFGMFLIPLYYFILVLIFYAVARDIPLTLIFAATLPLSGIAATELLKK
ncbi:MAG TPA: 1-acyl-sn-glycerol-3-phosphate acyltransferase [Chryseolinea sp.]|nr:1-acyl-sn-glycerol-3-phosphate acyltransferase [Chryseolinea sp.]